MISVRETIRREVSDRLGIPASPANDNVNLFELGLDSILIISLVLRIEEQFAIELSLKDLFGAPSIAAIADIIVLRQAESRSEQVQTVSPFKSEK